VCEEPANAVIRPILFIYSSAFVDDHCFAWGFCLFLLFLLLGFVCQGGPNQQLQTLFQLAQGRPFVFRRKAAVNELFQWGGDGDLIEIPLPDLF